GVWRGGQPTTEGWRHLKSLGVKWDVKLNPERQSSDAEAEAHGIQIIYLPISWVHEILAKPARMTLAAAVSALTRTNTFVHCEHGEDRTGLVVGAYRVMIEHWTKHAAYQEMKAHGFHPLLLGLYRSWQQDVEEPGPPAKASSQGPAPIEESSARGRSSFFWPWGRDDLVALARPQ
ncbi:MAG: hypothetical protein ABIO94_06975, partial [Opitutaceae bacterium]